MAAPGLKTVNEEVPVSRFRKYALIGAAVLVVLIGAAAAAYHFAVAALKQHIVDALGPNGEIAAIRVSTTAVEIDGLRVRAPSMPGWPARDVLRAEHVRVEPDLRSLLSDAIIIRRVNIEGAYLPILRNEKGLVLLPGMVGEPKRDAHDKQAEGGKQKSAKTVRLSTIELTDSRIDFYDATIRRPPHLIPLSEINAESGATVHVVDLEYDTGAILAQERVPVLLDDTPETLAERVLEAEHRLFPRVVIEQARKLLDERGREAPAGS